ncbi:MAG: NADH-quinone oxidoreductase subunit C [Planctomycetaceae bacterium]|nr:NADH-quinone oxidoreductase subunit C [Planctomycetaceae bacterium]
MSDPAKPAPAVPAAAPKKPRLAENDIDHELLKRKLGDRLLRIEVAFDQTVLHVARERLLEVLRTLHDDAELSFKMFTDVTAVDNLKREDFEPARRFKVVHIVYSLEHGKRLRLETLVPEQDPTCPSAAPIYKGAAWVEREVYDMFGIVFTGHPDLRRVLTPDYYEYHPLRKDYPLTGKGERDNFVRAEELA